MDFPEFEEDRLLVLRRAQESGIGVMQTICTRLSKFPQVMSLTSGRDNLYCSVGIHPHNVDDEPDFVPQEILQKIDQNKKIIGIGETGLDYFYVVKTN